MYLTQIMLANTVGINYIIADCQRMHTLVMSGFPSGDSETPRSDMAVLYDVEPTRSGVRVLIQSDIAPNIDAYRMYCARNTEPCVKNISALSEVLQNGMKLRFSHENPSIIQCYKDYLGAPLSEKSHHLLHTTYHSWKLPGEE